MRNSGFLLPSFLPWALIGVVLITTSLYVVNLKKQVVNLTAEKQILEISVKQLTDINKQNVLVIEKIKADKVKADKLITKIYAENDKNKKDLTILKSKISKLPDAPASQALKETVRSLQR
jgi:hypothetical protein